MQSEVLWGRTLESLLVEWESHNEIYVLTKHVRVAHTDFDFYDEGTTKIQFYQRAIKEGL